MRLSLGYPNAENERILLANNGKNTKKESIEAVFTQEEVSDLTKKVDDIFVSDPIIAYLQDLLQATRDTSKFVNGLSPRAGLQWLQASKALAFIEGRDSVLPQDVQLIAPYTALHRIQSIDGSDTQEEFQKILTETQVH